MMASLWRTKGFTLSIITIVSLLLPESNCKAKSSKPAAKPVGSDGVDGEIIYVSTWSKHTSRTEDRFGDDCGADGSHPCGSLLHALKAAEMRRSSLNSSSPMISILLLTDNPYQNCSVPFGFSGKHDRSAVYPFSLHNTRISPDWSASDCEKVLVRSEPFAEYGRIVLANSTGIQMDSLVFLSSSSALTITDSRFIHLNNCDFLVGADDMNKFTILSIQNSHDVIVTNCSFHPEDNVLLDPIQDLDLTKTNFPVVQVKIDKSRVTHDNGDVWTQLTREDWKIRNSVLRKTYTLMEEENSHVDNRSGGDLSVFFGGCHFQKLGYYFFVITPYIVSRHQCMGSALHIDLCCESQNKLVLLNSCNFTGNWHPQNSPLQIHFHREPCPESAVRGNLVHLRDITFDDNHALLGGAGQFLFHNTGTAYNLIRLTRVVFIANSAKQVGGALSIHFSRSTAQKNFVIAESCTFQSNHLWSLGEARRYPGGAIYLYRSQKQRESRHAQSDQCAEPYSNIMPAEILRLNVTRLNSTTLMMKDAYFTENIGAGAVYVRNTDIMFWGTSVFTGNTGSALVVRAAYAVFFDGPVTVTGNHAKYAGAFYVTESGQIDLGKVQEVNIFDNSMDSLGGGAVFADRDSSSASFDELLYNIGLEDDKIQECPVTFGKLNITQEEALMLNNSRKETRLTEHTFNAAFYVASWHDCYGSLNISSYPMSTEIGFIHVPDESLCPPYVGPLLFQHTEDDKCDGLADINNGPLNNGSLLVGMQILDQPAVCRSKCHNTTVINHLNLYRTRLMTRPAWMIFESTSTACYKEVGSDFPYFRKTCNRSHIVETLKSNTSDMHNTSWTIPVMDCPLYRLSLAHETYKASIPPILPGYNFLLTPWCGVLGSWNSFLSKGLQDIISKYKRKPDHPETTACSLSAYHHAIGNVQYDDLLCVGEDYQFESGLICKKIMDREKVFLTWPSPATSTFSPAGDMSKIRSPISMDRQSFDGDGLFRRCVIMASPGGYTNNWSWNFVPSVHTSLSKIMLHPAPGEQFDLKVLVLDEMFNSQPRTLKVQVSSPNNDVLAGHNGKPFGLKESRIFSSQREIWKFSVFGVPGSTGHIEVYTMGGGTLRNVNDHDLHLSIPFTLRGCHLGWKYPIIRESEVAASYVADYTRCCIESKQCSAVERNETCPIDKFKLQCRCPKDDDAAVEGCKDGQYLIIKHGFWAGATVTDRIPLLEKRRLEDSYNDTYFYDKNSDPFGYGDNGTYASAQCDNGVCHTSGRSWKLAEVQPCKKELNRTGPLCGLCINGTNVVIASETCYDCADRVTIALWLYLALLFVATLLLFLVLLVINLGMSPTLDSWLFFLQAVFYLFPDNTKISSPYLYFLTLGLSAVCIDDGLSRLTAKAVLVAQPIYLYFFVLLLWLAVRYGVCVKHLQRLQRRNSLAHVVWLVVVYSSSSIAYVAIMLLASIRLSTGKKVAFVDGSVTWFKDGHQYFAIGAILVLAVLVLPPPVILLVPYFRRVMFLKSFVDEATSIYEPHLPWWASFNLLRRLLLATIVTLLDYREERCIWMATTGVFMLSLHSIVRPYKRTTKFWVIQDADNKFESLLLVFYCCLCVARLGDVHFEQFPELFRTGTKPNDFYLPLFITPNVLAAGFILIRFLRSWYDTFRQKQRTKLTAADFFDGSDDLQRQHFQRLNSDAGSSTHSLNRSSQNTPGSSSVSNVPNSNATSLVPRPGARVSLDECQVPTGIREPLLLHAVLNPDGKDWSDRSV